MAEDAGDKTEAPTPKRRQEARDRGQIARSRDLTAAVLLIAFLMLMQNFGGGLIRAMKDMITYLLSRQSLSNTTSEGMWETSLSLIKPVALAMLPLLIGAMLVAILVNIVQVGLNFNMQRLQPNLGALNPLRGAGRIFKGPGFFTLGLNLIKMLVVGAVAWSAVQDRMTQIVGIQNLSQAQMFGLGCSIIYSIAMRLGVILLILAIVDYFYQRFHMEKELKMTKQEVKDEMRSMDGDPRIKNRRRQFALQMLKQKLRKDVPKADVVVTNPTEFAVALQYDAASMHAPRVVAKGRGYIAQQIREIAIANGIPILERKPLARALYKLVEVGREIPEEFYATVAEILAYVYELSGKLKRSQLQRVAGMN